MLAIHPVNVGLAVAFFSTAAGVPNEWVPQADPAAIANRAIGEHIAWSSRSATHELHRPATRLTSPFGLAVVDAGRGLLVRYFRRSTTARNTTDDDPRATTGEAEAAA